VVLGSGSTLSVWLNSAQGVPWLAWTATVPAEQQIRALRIGQVDGLGTNDLVIACSTTADPANVMQDLRVYFGL
jgi:hypothetical protein